MDLSLSVRPPVPGQGHGGPTVVQHGGSGGMLLSCLFQWVFGDDKYGHRIAYCALAGGLD